VLHDDVTPHAQERSVYYEQRLVRNGSYFDGLAQQCTIINLKQVATLGLSELSHILCGQQYIDDVIAHHAKLTNSLSLI
jgi:hypothetical protein